MEIIKPKVAPIVDAFANSFNRLNPCNITP